MKTCTKCGEFLPSTSFHVRRSHSTGLSCQCKGCTSRERKAHYEANRDRVLKRIKHYRKENPGRGRERSRRYNLWFNYKLTQQGYDALLASQDGRCAICDKQPPKHKYLCVDHDHNCCPDKRTCGECVRGLLCSRCNTALALYDNPATLQRIAEYVDRRVAA